MHDKLATAMTAGDLAGARALLDDMPMTDENQWQLIDGYADLSRALDHVGDHDAAIEALECAIEHGYASTPDPRSDIAELHLRAGRGEVAAAIWARLREETPADVWLYNAAGLTYQETGDHERAVSWFSDGLAVAMSGDDPEGVTAQLADLRATSLAAVGLPPDALQDQADVFVAAWKRPIRSITNADALLGAPSRANDAATVETDGLPVSLAWFPAGEYEQALAQWPSLAADLTGVTHADYSRRMDGHARWLGRQGIRVKSMSPLPIDELIAYCESRGVDPDESRAAFAAEQARTGNAIPWPPARNAPCWCGSGLKYKKCCASAATQPMQPAAGSD